MAHVYEPETQNAINGYLRLADALSCSKPDAVLC